MFKNWSKPEGGSVFRRFEEKIHKGPPLKEKIAQTIFRLKLQQRKLEEAASKLQRHDRELFEKCVAAELAKDDARAAIYANECAEVRKMAKIILLSQLALEQVSLRLETVEEFGDVLTQMAPVSDVVHSLKGRLAGVIPEVSYELGSIGEMLNGMMVEAGAASNVSWTPEAAGEESKAILNQASLVAEERMKEKFPDLPAVATAQREATEGEKPLR
jgi:division protein CdvB (Snf7/Vps24/ESCRT-III family)